MGMAGKDGVPGEPVQTCISTTRTCTEHVHFFYVYFQGMPGPAGPKGDPGADGPPGGVGEPVREQDFKRGMPNVCLHVRDRHFRARLVSQVRLRT